MRYLFLIRVAEDASPSPEQADPEAWVEETTRRGQRLLGERLRSDSDAADDEEALAIADRRPVDIAVIDLGLPDMPGEELVGVLRGKLEHCRFICLSGRRESEIDWRAAGFDHFVQKPARFERLKALILEG